MSEFFFNFLRYDGYDQTTGDTATVNDVVTKQYENLPYPPFEKTDLAKDKEHYKHHKNTLASIFHSATLENYNHFLHQENESFRYVHSYV